MSTPSRLRLFAAAALVAFPLAGCASIDVSSYVARGMDVRQYQTYDWGPMDALSTGDPRLDNNRFFDERVRADVEKELARRGFEKKTSGMPDVLIHYHASIAQRIDASAIDREYGYCEHGDCRAYVYDAGTLLIDFVDSRTNRLVWRGWAEGSMDPIDNQEWMEKSIDEAVTRILKELPPRL